MPEDGAEALMRKKTNRPIRQDEAPNPGDFAPYDGPKVCQDPAGYWRDHHFWDKDDVCSLCTVRKEDDDAYPRSVWPKEETTR